MTSGTSSTRNRDSADTFTAGPASFAEHSLFRVLGRWPVWLLQRQCHALPIGTVTGIECRTRPVSQEPAFTLVQDGTGSLERRTRRRSKCLPHSLDFVDDVSSDVRSSRGAHDV